MIKIDSAISFLKKSKKPETFDNIYKAIKADLADIHEDENAVKSELWNAFMSSIEIVRIQENNFDLSENYSIQELKRIEKLNSGVEDTTKEEG